MASGGEISIWKEFQFSGKFKSHIGFARKIITLHDPIENSGRAPEVPYRIFDGVTYKK